MELGILPEKLLLAKFRIPRLVKFLKQSGIHPVNRLFERSRTFKIPIPILHGKEAGPERLSSEFSSSSKFFSSGQHLEQHQHHKAATEVASCYTMEVATVK
jgi:hypothetical protein